MINPLHFRELVVVPTLRDMAEVFPGADNPMAIELMMGTAAHESHMGSYLKQVGGPALGVYQMEPVTHDDIWENYLAFVNDDRIAWVEYQCADPFAQHEMLVYDLRYATVMARLAYYRHSFDWPDPEDPQWLYKLADIWKEFYNTPSGKGTTAKFIRDYVKRVNV